MRVVEYCGHQPRVTSRQQRETLRQTAMLSRQAAQTSSSTTNGVAPRANTGLPRANSVLSRANSGPSRANIHASRTNGHPPGRNTVSSRDQPVATTEFRRLPTTKTQGLTACGGAKQVFGAAGGLDMNKRLVWHVSSRPCLSPHNLPFTMEPKSKAKHRQKVKHYNTPRHAHELTFSCYHRYPYLESPKACSIFLEELGQTMAGSGSR